MSYYLSESTIKACYDSLQVLNYSSSSVTFQFLLLKSAGFSTLDPIDLDSSKIKDKIFNAATRLASLFTNEDVINDSKKKYNFINPLDLQSWNSKNNISEPLIKWSKTRFKNNVLGGGEQWKSLIYSSEDKTSTITEKQHGLNKIMKTNEKIPVELLAIWFFRFTKFSNKAPKSQLITGFYKYFNLTSDERETIFSNVSTIKLEYSGSMINPSSIRKWLGNPMDGMDWINSNMDVDFSSSTNESIPLNSFQDIMISAENRSFDFYLNLLNRVKQVIFMGAPGTSKSYMANRLATSFDYVRRVQFHPQYTYQEFIGGQILEKGSLKDKKGIFTKFLEKAYENPDKEFLFIIEEINRANVSQVFGELIQLLDRGEHIKLSFNNKEFDYTLPNNLKIIGTMNTTDRTVGRIDFALKRRFYQIHFYPDYALLLDQVSIEGNEISVSDILTKINHRLVNTLNNREMVIGHAIFLNPISKNENGKYIWSKKDFCNLFNYIILPIIADYCDNNAELINSIVSGSLLNEKTGADFYKALEEFALK